MSVKRLLPLITIDRWLHRFFRKEKKKILIHCVKYAIKRPFTYIHVRTYGLHLMFPKRPTIALPRLYIYIYIYILQRHKYMYTNRHCIMVTIEGYEHEDSSSTPTWSSLRFRLLYYFWERYEPNWFLSSNE